MQSPAKSFPEVYNVMFFELKETTERARTLHLIGVRTDNVAQVCSPIKKIDKFKGTLYDVTTKSNNIYLVHTKSLVKSLDELYPDQLDLLLIWLSNMDFTLEDIKVIPEFEDVLKNENFYKNSKINKHGISKAR